MADSGTDKRRASGRRASLESGRADSFGKSSSDSNPGVFREMFGTKENPTVIPFKSIIKNPKIFFPTIALTAALTGGHILNPDASRELFFKSGAFSFAPEMLESGEAFFVINNVMSVSNGAVFIGHMIAGFIIDIYGLLPCALIGHFLAIVGYTLMFLLHFSSYAYYFAGVCFGVSLSCTFASRSRFMQMFPKVKNTVGMFLTIGMDFALLLPFLQDRLSELVGGPKVVMTAMVIIQSVILVHHAFIFPRGKLPERMAHQNSNISHHLEDETTDFIQKDEEAVEVEQDGIQGYRELSCIRKIFSLPFITFFIYMLFFALSRIHYQLFFRSTCQMNISDQVSAKKAADIGNIVYSLASYLSLAWGYIVDYNGLIITMQYQISLLIGAYFCAGFKSVSNIIPQILSNIFAGLYTCFANSLTYSFVAGVFGYDDFGVVQGLASLSAFVSFMSINYWQNFLENNLQRDYNLANRIIMYIAIAILVILFALRIIYGKKNK
ncbi:protein with 12 transmembrane domains [Cryptosporidium sp. chipmunk genotype I]|uniref:protein with 12 transmembrane domains n=1 Tax=Cryptosporidium sp. chipmunk genotype I TaxID=1280935 RepID=UPI00351A6382|nr:protein with 12 transmembrane domains [Cryptosporidium sp. chipmunk genotype I]